MKKWCILGCLPAVYLIEQFQKHVAVFDPFNSLQIVWNILVCLVIALNVFFIPMEVAFNLQDLEFLNDLQKMSTVIIVLNLLINFNTAYFERGDLVSSRRMIFHRLLKQELLWQILSILAVMNISFSLSYLRLVFLYQLRPLNVYFNKMREFF